MALKAFSKIWEIADQFRNDDRTKTEWRLATKKPKNRKSEWRLVFFNLKNL